MPCIDLHNDTLMIVGTIITSPRTKNRKRKKGFVRLKMRNLTLEVNIIIFKTILKELEKTQKAFFWKNSTPQIKPVNTLYDASKDGEH